MRHLASWLWYSLLHPAHADFVSMGFGIRQRSKRYAHAWSSHLAASKDVIFKVLANEQQSLLEEVVVLGAGRLLDAPIEALCGEGRTVRLLDYDISAADWWQRTYGALYPSTRYEVVDVTGVLETWSFHLSEALRTKESATATVHCLSSLKAPPSLFNAPIIISLNLLSQIPLYWRARAELLITKGLGRKKSEAVFHHLEVQKALRLSEAALIAAHVEGIMQSFSSRLLLIVDGNEEGSDPINEMIAHALSEFDPPRHEVKWRWQLVPDQRIRESSEARVVRALYYERTASSHSVKGGLTFV